MSQQIDKPNESRQRSKRGQAREHSSFVPLLLLALAFLAYISLQAVHLVTEASDLKRLHTEQNQLVQKSAKVRESLDAIERELQSLAKSDNPNSRLILDDLRKRGFAIGAPKLSP